MLCVLLLLLLLLISLSPPSSFLLASLAHSLLPCFSLSMFNLIIIRSARHLLRHQRELVFAVSRCCPAAHHHPSSSSACFSLVPLSPRFLYNEVQRHQERHVALSCASDAELERENGDNSLRLERRKRRGARERKVVININATRI